MSIERAEVSEQLNDRLRHIHARYPHDPDVEQAYGLSNADVTNHSLDVIERGRLLAFVAGGVPAERNPHSNLSRLTRRGGMPTNQIQPD